MVVLSFIPVTYRHHLPSILSGRNISQTRYNKIMLKNEIQ
ncbi:hypothetical protein P20480_2669 [Pseudoalteromonas sp. BSi20480]|jgi:hypothetical protein|nr:hypothetical protein P20480_2669 [Pseudoalteromonas sp. BSi20480]